MLINCIVRTVINVNMDGKIWMTETRWVPFIKSSVISRWHESDYKIAVYSALQGTRDFYNVYYYY